MEGHDRFHRAGPIDRRFLSFAATGFKPPSRLEPDARAGDSARQVSHGLHTLS